MPLAASAVIVSTVLAGVTLLWPRAQIEDQLARAAGSALAAAGFANAGLTVSGRDATISDVPDAGRQAAIDAVQAVPGIRVAAAGEPGAVAPATAPAQPFDTAASDAAKAAAEQALRAAVPGAAMDNRLPVAAAPAGELDAAAKEQLQSRITTLLAAAPITFGPDSPQLTAPGSAAVATIVEALRPAAGARVQVDGYVAAGPGNGQLTAQQLSEGRAATVRDALVAAGIPGDRIVARGLGEGTTPADRALGRRVVITVV